MGLRHSGNTEVADLTDAQLRALSGHKTAAMSALHKKVRGAAPGGSPQAPRGENEMGRFVEMSR